MTDSTFSDHWHHDRLVPWRRLRVAFLATLGGSVAWICFTLLYVAFWAHGFSLFQSIAILIVSLLILGALIAGAWISFGMRFARHWTD